MHAYPRRSNLETQLSPACSPLHQAPINSPAQHTLYLRQPDGCNSSSLTPALLCRFVVTAPEDAPALHAEQASEQAQHGDMLFAAPGSTLTHQVPPAHGKLPINRLHACVLRALWHLLPLAMICWHCHCTKWPPAAGKCLGPSSFRRPLGRARLPANHSV